jgi:hypothetical protein
VGVIREMTGDCVRTHGLQLSVYRWYGSWSVGCGDNLAVTSLIRSTLLLVQHINFFRCRKKRERQRALVRILTRHTERLKLLPVELKNGKHIVARNLKSWRLILLRSAERVGSDTIAGVRAPGGSPTKDRCFGRLVRWDAGSPFARGS